MQRALCVGKHLECAKQAGRLPRPFLLNGAFTHFYTCIDTSPRGETKNRCGLLLWEYVHLHNFITFTSYANGLGRSRRRTLRVQISLTTKHSYSAFNGSPVASSFSFSRFLLCLPNITDNTQSTTHAPIAPSFAINLALLLIISSNF